MATKKTTDEAAVAEKAEIKKAPAKKAAAKKPAAKKPAAKKAAPKKATAVKKPAAKTAAAKKPAMMSKGKQRKIVIEDKFSGRTYHLGIGKRKNAIAIVRIHTEGKGKFFVNNKPFSEYFNGTNLENAMQPLTLTGNTEAFDITIKVTGGGTTGQTEAVRHGLARALEKYEAELRPTLKKAGLLTRDSRRKARKKPGLRGARKSPQWSKR